MSNKRSDSPVQADGPACQLLRRLSSSTCWTAMSENCLDRPVQGLVGPASTSIDKGEHLLGKPSPSACQMAVSENCLDLPV
ncbi:hypothetical protein PSTG_07403 [Puccinia striiformis f. sp. tritici PST-78]|uniref:Uncharacterized protein n=1 Tax=Puccinia striiformis f. sp. tritici PST-78 TaxID=1165861 RepID=A0A0L0VJ14_9BASI|nr:hypothetical protein PSTG_07403 [Puccinia striiformis f. sp. tritici PST-78]